MDVFEAHKYLDPTTFDQSPFLSFSSFADLTSDCLTLSSSSPLSPSSVPVKQQHHTPTPPASHSSDSPSPSSPFASVFLTTPSTPAVSRYTDFGHQPPTAFASSSSSSHNHAHHVKQRSSSSTSDWNSPVTPSLTYKSSVESFSQDPDFFLPPSSTHSASTPFGWDDQFLYGGNGNGSGPSHPVRSPPSPSPYRVASNPQLGAAAYRHPRSVKHVMSMPSLNEEAPSLAMGVSDFYDPMKDDGYGTGNLGPSLSPDFDLDDFLNDAEFGSALTDDNADTSPLQGLGQDERLSDEVYQALAAAANLTCDIDNQSTATTQPNAQTSSAESASSLSVSPVQLTLPTVPAALSTPIELAPSLVPDVSSASTVSNFEPSGQVQQYTGWQPDLSGSQGFVDIALPSNYSNVFPNVVEQNHRPYTADAPSGMPKVPTDANSLAIPSGMQRSISANAVPTTRGPGAPPPLPVNTPGFHSALTSPPWNSLTYYPSPEILQQTGFESRPPPPRTDQTPLLMNRVPSGTGMSGGQTQWHGGNYSPYASAVQGTPLMSSATGMSRTLTEPLPGAYPQSRTTSAKYSQQQIMKPTANPSQLAMSAYPSNLATPQSQQVYWQSPVQVQAALPQQLQAQPMLAQQSMPIGLGYPQSGFYSSSSSAPTTSAGFGNGSVPGLMSNTPLHTIHPPANSFVPNPHTRPVTQPIPAQPHRVHPPPQPLTQQASRPIAKMPSGAAGRRPRNATGSTSAPKPKAPRAAAAPRKNATPSGGVDTWCGTQFHNYTPADGKKILSGVAPSGSQSKRKREEEAAAAAAAAGGHHLSVPMGYTHSGSSIGSNGADDRSKRSKSSASR